MNVDFSNKNIFVGGATDGIGWSCAQSFAELGANVVLVSRNLEKLNSRLAQLTNNVNKIILCLRWIMPITLI